MKQAAGEAHKSLTPEEAVAIYRHYGWEGRTRPVVVYHPPHHPCPWPGCNYRIAGIDFRLETLGSSDQVERWLAAWWKGPGLLARCPGCGRLVRFQVPEKQAVEEPTIEDGPALPEDWHQKSHLVRGSES